MGSSELEGAHTLDGDLGPVTGLVITSCPSCVTSGKSLSSGPASLSNRDMGPEYVNAYLCPRSPRASWEVPEISKGTEVGGK